MYVTLSLTAAARHLLIYVFTTAFGFLFPFGMVLGLARNRWHVPVQILATALFVVGYFLAHAHAGRNYVSSSYSLSLIPISRARV